MEALQKTVNEVLGAYALPGELLEAVPFGSGHINDTVRLTFKEEDGAVKRYVLQRLNTNIFKDPEGVMQNTVTVTAHLREKIRARGGDPERETLNVVMNKAGGSFAVDGGGGFWRVTRFIEGARSYDVVGDPVLMQKTGRAFGVFQKDLRDLDATALFEVLPNFHNTPMRFGQFTEALGKDCADRAKTCRAETEFLLGRKALAFAAEDLRAAGELPLRVTHNDTKLNNVMFDEKTGEPVAVIDLDTVMPGLVLYDLGDAVRTGANTGGEDEKDTEKIGFAIGMYEAFLRGFLEESANALTLKECETLPLGALLITYEQALRFLADYLAGDTYYKTAYPEHNLVRARTQIKLLSEMEKARERMEKVNADCIALYRR